MNKLETFTPGKLFLAGEYFVVNGDSDAVLYPLIFGINIHIEESDTYQIVFDKTYQSTVFNPFGENVIVNYHIDTSIKTVFRVLNKLHIKPRPVKIKVVSTLESTDGVSYGFGSSGALVVGIIKSLFDFYQVDINKLELYKLSVIALKDKVKYASFGDIAVSVFKEPILYHVFNKDWFLNQESHDILSLYKKPWDGLKIDKITLSLPLHLVVNTKVKSSSENMVESFQNLVDDDLYNEALSKHKRLMKRLLKHDYVALLEMHVLYQDISDNTDFPYMVEAYEKLAKISSKHHGFMKVSGAGGGDNVIIFFDNRLDKDQCHYELLKLGYLVFNGVIKE